MGHSMCCWGLKYPSPRIDCGTEWAPPKQGTHCLDPVLGTGGHSQGIQVTSQARTGTSDLKVSCEELAARERDWGQRHP